MAGITERHFALTREPLLPVSIVVLARGAACIGQLRDTTEAAHRESVVQSTFGAELEAHPMRIRQMVARVNPIASAVLDPARRIRIEVMTAPDRVARAEGEGAQRPSARFERNSAEQSARVLDPAQRRPNPSSDRTPRNHIDPTEHTEQPDRCTESSDPLDDESSIRPVRRLPRTRDEDEHPQHSEHP